MRKEIAYSLAALAFCGLVLFLDTSIPRGYVEWFLYIIPLFIIYRAERAFLTYLFLAIIAVLLALGYLLSPEVDIPPLVSITDRAEGLIAFAAFTFIINNLIRARKELAAAKELTEKKSIELEAANRELESFSYSASHDLRAPLRSMKEFNRMLLEDYSNVLDDTGREYLSRIDTNALRMEALIEDLLNLSKISRQEMHLEEVDLSRAATAILSELAQSHPERAVQCRVQEGLTARGDIRLINIALSNLLGNAWKYTGKTKNAQIEVGAKNTDGRTVYYIRDNGAGFDMRHAERLFTPFQRLHSESEFSGTGIGLAIVERIIKRHGGRIWAESQVGKGSTFYFTLGG